MQFIGEQIDQVWTIINVRILHQQLHNNILFHRTLPLAQSYYMSYFPYNRSRCLHYPYKLIISPLYAWSVESKILHHVTICFSWINFSRQNKSTIAMQEYRLLIS